MSLSTALNGSEFPSLPSFRHTRRGTVGVDGQLPSGWTGESTGSITVEDVSPGAAIQLDLRFEGDLQTDFVSLTIGSFVHPQPQGLYLSRVDLEFLESENLDAAFTIIREWIPNGACVRQTTRQISLAPGLNACVVAKLTDTADLLLQPVLSFKRLRASPGRVRLVLRRPMLANLYEYPGWLSSFREAS